MLVPFESFFVNTIRNDLQLLSSFYYLIPCNPSVSDNLVWQWLHYLCGPELPFSTKFNPILFSILFPLSFYHQSWQEWFSFYTLSLFYPSAEGQIWTLEHLTTKWGCDCNGFGPYYHFSKIQFNIFFRPILCHKQQLKQSTFITLIFYYPILLPRGSSDHHVCQLFQIICCDTSRKILCLLHCTFSTIILFW